MEIACYSLSLKSIANRAITKMSCFKIYASVTLIFRKQVPLNEDNSHISLYGDLFEINNNEKKSKSIVYCLW